MWAIIRDETTELYEKLIIKTRGTRYKPRDTGPDTAGRRPHNFVFHNAIIAREFATNSRVAGQDTADCGRSTFTFHSAKNMRKPVKLARRTN